MERRCHGEHALSLRMHAIAAATLVEQIQAGWPIAAWEGVRSSGPTSVPVPRGI